MKQKIKRKKKLNTEKNIILQSNSKKHLKYYDKQKALLTIKLENVILNHIIVYVKRKSISMKTYF